LGKIVGANRVSLFGGKLHLLAAGEKEIMVAEQTLAQAGITVSARKKILPSLEDVFINRITQDQAEQAS
jgi:ABC-2 type transport system ATP-binding protein